MTIVQGTSKDPAFLLCLTDPERNARQDIQEVGYDYAADTAGYRGVYPAPCEFVGAETKLLPGTQPLAPLSDSLIHQGEAEHVAYRDHLC